MLHVMWLVSPLITMQYTVYFRFCGWCYVFT